MDTSLTDPEIYLLDKFIPRLKMYDAVSLNKELRSVAEEERANLADKSQTDINVLQKNVARFLIDKAFIRSHDDTQFFLTEKGKNLKKEGSLAKYTEWQASARSKNKEIIHTIETRGYLDQNQDQVVKERRSEQLKRYVAYPALIVILIIILAAVANHFKLFHK